MKPNVAVLAVVLAAAAAPLLAPQDWAQHGAFPDVAALVVLHLAIAGTPERAALLGVAIGALRCVWTPEPFGLDAALYGTLGWSGAHAGRALFEERAGVRMVAAGASVVALRAASAGVSALAAPSGASSGTSLAAWAWSTLGASLATALVAPFAFGALRATRALSAFERRRLRDV